MVFLHRDKIDVRYRICWIISFIFICFILSVILFSTRKPSNKTKLLNDTFPNLSYSDLYRLTLEHENDSLHKIYIDIGCYNGETIEHFIHFFPDSITYDIITFEPEPSNYELCKKTLQQDKYKDYSITILPFAVWVRNERVFFQTNQGRKSRINGNVVSANKLIVDQVNAIDFSSWLQRLWKPDQTHIQIKMSMPGAEIAVLEKMIIDGSIDYVNKYEIEWADRENPHLRATRIYIQLMFDNRGFDTLYYTRLQDARKVIKSHGRYNDITKHYNWTWLHAVLAMV